ncbi:MULTISPECIES: YbaB/EbfC family nucleoid-associated protein [unclassified Nonomuraea]|uniref:YbaB/EbfC family nucleoid-associated protein n=1 Tax=unclassified Nonomuraea TaxID=2593643 RepID=UPI003408776F
MRPFGEMDAAAARVYADELRQTFMRLQEEGPDLHARALAVQVTERSPDGLISATVDAHGRLVLLDIDPRVYRRPDARLLADTITATIHRAAEQAQERILAIFEPLVPPERMRAHFTGDLDALTSQLTDQMTGEDGTRARE